MGNTDKNSLSKKFQHGETLEELEKMAIELLKDLKALNVDKAVNGTELLDKAKDKNNEINENTFRQTLSALTKSEDSIITKVENKHGYYLSETAVKKPDFIPLMEISEEDKKKTISKREFALYPILETWLRDQDYRVGKEIFNKKINETWGNPDVAGLKTEEHFSKFEVEIVTIEAKSSKDQFNNNWRIDIFEAVSHRRFSNRVYFAFAHKKGDKIPELSEMKYYCELYQIGLLTIELSPSLFSKFEKAKISENGFSEEEAQLINVNEIVPARFNTVPLKYQRSFCKKTLEITKIGELYSFGQRS